MPQFEKQKNPNRSGFLARSAGRDRSMPKPAHDDNSLLAPQQALGNQAMQRFAQSCPLTLPSASICPFGGVCHTCPVRVQTKTAIDHRNNAVYKQDYEQENSQNQNEYPMQISNGTTKELVGQGTCNECLHSSISQTATTLNDILRRKAKKKSLDTSSQTFMEYRFGVDFEDVEIHTDENAHLACRMLNANAFTIGHHIFFDQGQYDPHSKIGKKLLAHELAHVVQQRGNEPFSFHKSVEVNKLENEAGQFAQNMIMEEDQGVMNITPLLTSEKKSFFESESGNKLESSLLTSTHPGILRSARREGESYRDCINRGLSEMGLEIHIGWITIGICGVVAVLAGAVGAEAGVIPPAVLAAAACLAFATGVEVGILAGILWQCR